MPSDLARARSLEADLEAFGHLHAHLASGAEASLQKHDVERDGTTFVIDSRLERATFEITDVEFWKPDDSHITPS